MHSVEQSGCVGTISVLYVDEWWITSERNIRNNTFPARVDTCLPAAPDALLLFVVLGVFPHAARYSTERTGMGDSKDYRHYQDNSGQIGFDRTGHITVGIGNGVGFDLTNGHLTISTGSGFSIDTGM